jgi:hypothetical protein
MTARLPRPYAVLPALRSIKFRPLLIYSPALLAGSIYAMTENGRFHIGELDISARAGLLLGASATGMSYQNCRGADLTRGG